MKKLLRNLTNDFLRKTKNIGIHMRNFQWQSGLFWNNTKRERGWYFESCILDPEGNRVEIVA
ncbi:MAG: hypothetical protein JW915_11060 [Chitinispirillaceae bacterium]|nr:hypothetical protein [Chitinispirillaceae bacterium]